MAREEDILQRIVLEGDKVIIRQLELIGKEGAKAFKQLEEAAASATSGTAFAALQRSFTQIRAGMAQAGVAARQLGTEWRNLSTQARTAVRQTTLMFGAVGLVTGGLLELARRAANAGGEIKDTAEGLGLSVERFQELSQVAALAGVNQQKFAQSQVRGQNAAEQALEANRDYEKGLTALRRQFGLGKISLDQFNDGISELQFKMSQTDNPFKDLGVQIARTRDGAVDWEETQNRLADSIQRSGVNSTVLSAATKIYGREARRMLVVLKDGRAGLEAQAQEARRLGLVLSKDVIERLDNLGDEFDRFGTSSANTVRTLTAVFAPTLQRLFRGLIEDAARTRAGFVVIATDIANRLRPVVDDFLALLEGREGDIAQDSIVLKIRDAVRAAAQGIDIAINRVIIPAFQTLLAAADGVAQGINRMFGTDFTGGGLLVAGVVLKITGAFGLLAGAIRVAYVAGQLLLGLFGGPIRLVLIALSLLLSAGFVDALKRVDWQGFANTARAAFDTVLGYFTNFAAVLTALWQALAERATLLWAGLGTQAQTAITFIQTLWTTFVEWITGVWTTIGEMATALWTLVSDQATIAVDYITNIFAGMRDTIIGYWTSIRDFIISAYNSVKSAISGLAGGAESAGGAGAPGFRRGGPIRGPGTPTSDSVLMWGSAGEFMQPYAAVKKYGLAFMESIRTLRFNPDGFAMGGLIDFSPPQPGLRFAEGGLVGAGSNGRNVLNLTIGDRTFNGLTAPDKTMQELTRFATQRQIRSAGRKPGWQS